MRLEVGENYVSISVRGLNITKAKDVENFIEKCIYALTEVDEFENEVKTYEIVEDEEDFDTID